MRRGRRTTKTEVALFGRSVRARKGITKVKRKTKACNKHNRPRNQPSPYFHQTGGKDSPSQFSLPASQQLNETNRWGDEGTRDPSQNPPLYCSLKGPAEKRGGSSPCFRTEISGTNCTYTAIQRITKRGRKKGKTDEHAIARGCHRTG